MNISDAVELLGAVCQAEKQMKWCEEADLPGLVEHYRFQQVLRLEELIALAQAETRKLEENVE